MVYLDNYLHARNERLLKGKREKRPRIIVGERRRHVIDEVMNIMKDWRFSEFQHEASCRHGLRMALCLDGHRWPLSDFEAGNIVASALTTIGAKRPSWDEGQREHTTASEDCLWCGRDLPEDQTSGGRSSRFCDGICARAHLAYRDFETTRTSSRSHSQAYEVLARERRPERSCEHCGCQYRPRSRRAVDDQRFCSKSCVDAAKLSYDRQQRECPTCAKSFLPTSPRQKFCEVKCYAASLRKHRPRDCRGCGNSFTPYNSSMIYCSSACYHRKAPEPRDCQHCGNAFQPKNSQAIYCGTSCRDRAAIKRSVEASGSTYRPFGSMWEATCECCDGRFLTKSHRSKTCSISCREVLRLGGRPARADNVIYLTAEIFDGWFKRAA